ncbi:hypothetical protein CEXT_371161 [Caerostris extrusa]|uniref:Uncharacterized protein n=1 Tax=Caerostris extrusa TaxID=172846 RepID=A0AAV4NAK9_CAEEX|nr:hypothetical protein CEXT_371161 [Caerostris extrusa]
MFLHASSPCLCVTGVPNPTGIMTSRQSQLSGSFDEDELHQQVPIHRKEAKLNMWFNEQPGASQILILPYNLRTLLEILDEKAEEITPIQPSPSKQRCICTRKEKFTTRSTICTNFICKRHRIIIRNNCKN